MPAAATRTKSADARPGDQADHRERQELDDGLEVERRHAVDRLVAEQQRTTTVGRTAETTAGPKSPIEKEPTTTSRTKSVAAIGVL